MQMGNITITLGVAAVAIGITIMLNDPEGKITGGIVALCGLALCLFAYLRVETEEKKEQTKRDEAYSSLEDISTNIKELNTNISNLINEIRLDRESRIRGK